MEKRSFKEPQTPRKKQALDTDIQEINSNLLVPGPEFKEKLRTDVVARPPSVSELEELDHLIVSAAYQLDQLLVKFQWLGEVNLEELSNSNLHDQLLRSLMKKPRVRLAALLIKQYWRTGIPVFDDILFTRHSSGISTLPWSFGTGALDTEYIDQLQALLLQSATDSLKLMKQRSESDTKFLQTQKSVDGLVSCLKTDTDTVTEFKKHKKHSGHGKWPPKLPKIHNDELLKQVFTHKSAITHASVNATNLLHVHNERLEFKGDSILDFIVCQLLYDEFPNDSEGMLSIKKSTLVCNDTLFDFSTMYKLYEKLQMSSDLHSKVFSHQDSSIPDADHKNKAIADVFEAYIAGLAIDRGLLVVQNWLKLLYQPLILDMKNGNIEEEVDKNSKNELYRKVGSVNQPISYITLNETSPFEVKCMIGGSEAGRGVDRTVKLAGLRAAESVLKQPNLVEKYAAIRREVPKTAPNTSK